MGLVASGIRGVLNLKNQLQEDPWGSVGTSSVQQGEERHPRGQRRVRSTRAWIREVIVNSVEASLNIQLENSAEGGRCREGTRAMTEATDGHG